MSEIFKDGIDTGYRENQNWWQDSNSPERFRIAKLHEDYPEVYFKEDHVSHSVVQQYCNHVAIQYEIIAKKRLNTIIEFGCGGGWFSKEFDKRGYSIFGLEGTYDGIEKCKLRQFYRVSKIDLRCYIQPPRKKYDIALCTEVAGHIEPPFSSMLVLNLVNHSDIIWWSSEEPFANRAHLHHPNEQPYEYWINLFEFYGYGAIRLSDEIFNDCERRGRYLFYKKLKYDNA
jgi:predicted TPR repeat methyltransferase